MPTVAEFDQYLQIVITLLRRGDFEGARTIFNQEVVRQFGREMGESPFALFTFLYRELDDLFNSPGRAALQPVSLPELFDYYESEYPRDLKQATIGEEAAK